MDVLVQAPQPTIKCYHSFNNNIVVKSKIPYQNFTPGSNDTSGRNLQSYNFERSIENFGGSFSFTIKEDTEKLKDPFMDKVQPLDIIVISESGYDEKIDFIGVVTTISIGGIASNLNKVVTVSGKSIEWLFAYYNINCDIKCEVFNNESANRTFITDLADNDGDKGISIKDIAIASIKAFREEVSNLSKAQDNAVRNGKSTILLSNFLIGEIIDVWFGTDANLYIDASKEIFAFPISSNLFTSGKINIIDYLKKLIPSPIYEIFGTINNNGDPIIKVRKVPFDNPKASYLINPDQLTDYTLTRSCEEVYTAFMTYIEGTDQSPDFYMNLQAAQNTEQGYNFAQPDRIKAAKYGYQLLTCSFVGYNNAPDATKDNEKINNMNLDLKRWFSNLDEMYSGDFTFVNVTNSKEIKEKPAKIGEWVNFAQGLYYVISEKHSWAYGDNPMINYQVTRGGNYVNGEFTPVKRLSAVYKEFE